MTEQTVIAALFEKLTSSPLQSFPESPPDNYHPHTTSLDNIAVKIMGVRIAG